MGLEVDQGDGQRGQLATLDALDQDVGTVVVELVRGIGRPRECKQALIRVSTAGYVLGDQDGPLVINLKGYIKKK